MLMTLDVRKTVHHSLTVSLMVALTILLMAFFLGTSNVAADSGPNFEVFRSLMKADQWDEAFRVLSKDVEKEKNANLKSLSYFGLGYISQMQKKDEKAVEYFDLALVPTREFEDIIRVYKGRSLKTLGKPAEAKVEFQTVQNAETKVGRAVIESQMELAELEIADKKWAQASSLLSRLEKRTRSDLKYPEVLMGLVRTELARGRKHVACKWARKLYSKYPHVPLTVDWTLDLQKVQIDSRALDCLAAISDQKTRIRTLQLQGQSDRALKDIQELKLRAGSLALVHVDTLLAHFYLTEGRITEALNTLLPYYKKDSQDFSFFMLLARVAARAGEFQIAVGSYQRAYNLNPNSKAGRTALFQAAFLSYQFQDYDGAVRRFEEFIKKYSRSGLSQDAKWHLAWIRYLKADYPGAFDGFKALTQVSRGRRKSSPVSEKNRYWMAMSLFKMGRVPEAAQVFEQIAADKSFGFYSLSAKARLQTIKPDGRSLAKQTDKTNEKSSDSTLGEKLSDQTQLSALSEAAQTLSDSEENESEDNEKTLATMTTVDDETAEADDSGAPAEEAASLQPFQSGNMAKRFQRANDLITLGFSDWAKWELYELERRTSQPQHLKTLVSRYESIEAYNRSSYISQIYFSRQRTSSGFKGDGRNFWVSTYPRAFERSVTTFARSFNVPEEFSWAIMRAESQFKSDVKSPVGALGLMQLMPYTALQVSKILDLKGFTTSQLFDPGTNVRLGTRYLQRLLNQFDSSIPVAAAAYNAGPHKVRSWLKSFGAGLEMDEFVEHIPYLETRNYVKKVVQNYYVYRQLYSKSAKPEELLPWLAKPVGITITGDVESRESWDTP
jgi:soluble lytic murein transglycosylase